MGGLLSTTHQKKKVNEQQWIELGDFKRLERSQGKNVKQWSTNGTWRGSKAYYLVPSEGKIVYGTKNKWEGDKGSLKKCENMKLQEIQAMFYKRPGDSPVHYFIPKNEDTEKLLNSANKFFKDNNMKNVILIVRNNRNHVLQSVQEGLADVTDNVRLGAFGSPLDDVSKKFVCEVKNAIHNMKAAALEKDAVDLKKEADDLDAEVVTLEAKRKGLEGMPLLTAKANKNITEKKNAAAEKRTASATKESEAVAEREKKSTVAKVRRRLNYAGAAELGTSPACALDTNAPSNLELGSLPVLMILLTLLFLLGWVLKRRFNLFQQKERVRRDTFGFLPDSSRLSLNAAERMV